MSKDCFKCLKETNNFCICCYCGSFYCEECYIQETEQCRRIFCTISPTCERCKKAHKEYHEIISMDSTISIMTSRESRLWRDWLINSSYYNHDNYSLKVQLKIWKLYCTGAKACIL